MSLYLEERGSFREWNGREKIGNTSYQPNIGDLWPPEELAALNLYEPVVPPVPPGKQVAGKTVQRVKGVVTFVYVLESVPLSDLNRIQFEFMVEKLGIGPAIEQAIAAMSDGTDLEQNAKIMARVLYRSGQRFERSHPLFTELASAVGLTAEQVDAAWRVALSI
jgi:hypothetical protein